MEYHFKKICLWAVFFMPLAYLQALPSTGFIIKEKNDDHLTIEWNLPDLQWQEIGIESKKYLLPELPGALPMARIGGPMLPAIAYTIPVPVAKRAIVTIHDEVFIEETVSFPICPVPRYQDDQENPVVAVYEEDGLIYQSDSFFPLEFWQTEIGTHRDQRYLKLNLYPLQYNSPRNRAKKLQFARFDVQFVRESVPVFSSRKQMARAAEWLNSAESFIKLCLVEEGPYAVSGAELQSLGVNLSNINPSTCKIIFKGQEQSSIITGMDDGRFDPQDQVQFYGARRHGNGEFYDAYSDTNVYWLSWGGSDGSRYRLYSVPNNEPVLDTFIDTLHIEKDVAYYAGDSDADIHNTETVAGEGWQWAFINRYGAYSFSFDLPFCAPEGDSIRLWLRLRGTTLDTRTPDHHVQITINAQLACDFYFNDREEKIIEFSMLRSKLLSQGNQVEIRSIGDTPAERSQFYFDWLEVRYNRMTRAKDNWLLLSHSQNKSAHYFLDGFGDGAVSVWDLDKSYAYNAVAGGRQWRGRFSVTSAGYLDGETAFFGLDGTTIATGRRGHNLVRLDALDGHVVEQKNFDTYESTAQADSMAAYINRLPSGAVVLVAIRDEGSVSMTNAAHQALTSLGSAQTRSVGVRDSWVLFGRKDAAPGSVAELLKKSKSGPAVLSEVLEFQLGGASYSAQVSIPAGAGSHLMAFEPTGLKKPLRIKVYQPSNLNAEGQSADYLIITHPLFKTQAKRLAAYREQKNNLRSKVVLVEDIEDEFNYGLADPMAIRSFLQYAYNQWNKPAPQFVLFFGDASWDPKELSYNANQKNYVPTYGNPVSDTWFACFDGPGDVLAEMNVGRLAVASEVQAAAMVDKIISYENTPSATWKKEFLFISGGFDYIEQMQFSQQSRRLVDDFVTVSPTCGQAVFLHKTTQGLGEGEHRQDILESINNGMIWVNFIGHAGSRTWDLMFHNADIDALANEPRFPFITSMTCHTGRFAEPNQVAFGEYFLLTANKGAIGFLGTSGWGYSYEDYSFLRHLYPKALQDTLRYLGEIVTQAKWALWQSSAGNSHITDMVQQYNLLGDPAVKLAIPVQPDLSVRVADIIVTPDMPSEADSLATVKVLVNNYGLATQDSVEVSLSSIHPTLGESEIGSKKMKAIGRLDSTAFDWHLRNMAGTVDLRTLVDPHNRLIEADEDNNSQRRSVTILSSRIQLVAPPMDALVPPQQVVLKILNPQVKKNTVRSFVFTVDTTLSFNSPLVQSSEAIVPNSIVVSWRPQNLLPGRLYYWRAVDLSEPASLPGLISVFTTAAGDEYGWDQGCDFSLAKNVKNNLRINSGVQLEKSRMPLYVESAGFWDGNFARILVNERPALQPHRGHNLAVLDPKTGALAGIKNYDTYADSNAANAMADFIASLPENYIVMAALMDEGTVSMTQRAYQALESIGSALCRKVEPRYSWAIIGRKGAALGTVPESMQIAKLGTAVAEDTLSFFEANGLVMSPLIGAAGKWRRLTWRADVPPACDLQVKVLGQNKNSTQTDILFVDLHDTAAVDLSSIDAQQYPYLRLQARLSTQDGYLTPVFKEWRIEYEPVPDLAVSRDYFSSSADSVLSGESVTLKFRLFNIGMNRADSFALQFSEIDPYSNISIFSSILIRKPLLPDEFIDLDQLWTPRNGIGLHQAVVRIDPENRLNELNESNNVLTSFVYMRSDTSRPWIRVLYDDREIAPGDMVASAPIIRGLIYDNSPLLVADTLAVTLLLDNQNIPFAGNESILRLQPAQEAGTRGIVEFRPQLTAGDHSLEISFADASGNRNSYLGEFRVVTGLKVLNVLNYPNPFARDTEFTFELSQSAQVSIKIFTVAGRLIRAVDPGWLNAGFNRIAWNGRDEDGDELANGVYIYRVAARTETSHVEVIEKAVVMR